MRLNTGKKLKTDSLNLRSTGFKKEEFSTSRRVYFYLLTFEKF